MKNNLLIYVLGILCSVTFCANARSGVYLTYNDFKNGNLLKADDKTFSFNLYKKNITMKVNGEKQKFEAKETWGYLQNDELYRVIAGPQKMQVPAKLISAGTFYTWYYSESTTVNKTEHTNLTGQGGGFNQTSSTTYNIDLTYVSYGVNGEPYLMFKKKQMQEAVAGNAKFKPIMDCADPKKTSLMNPYLVNVMECLKDQPGFTTDLKGIVPPDKN